MMRCKTITSNLLTVVGLLVEPSTPIAKPKASIKAYLSIRPPPWTVTSSKPVIYPSLSCFFSLSSMLRSNSRSHRSIWYWWSTVESYVENSDNHCGRRNRTGKMKCKESRKCLCFINLNKGGMLFAVSPVSVKKLSLKQSRTSRYENSLIPINLSQWGDTINIQRKIIQ